MSLSHSLSLYPRSMRRLGADGEEAAPYADEERTRDAAQPAALDATAPRWQIPLYQQPERPSRAAIAAYQSSIAAERRLSVPVGVNIMQQAEQALMEANDDFRHCDCCEAPIDVVACNCPYCGWGE